jgi:hypothetical protein
MMIDALAPQPVFVNAPLRDANFRRQSVDHVMKAGSAVYRLEGGFGVAWGWFGWHSTFRSRASRISPPNTTPFPRLPRGGLGALWTNSGHALVNSHKAPFFIRQAYLIQRFTRKAQGCLPDTGGKARRHRGQKAVVGEQ